MKLSTRSRYGMRFMIELAARNGEGRAIFLKEISSAQSISEKYLSKLAMALKVAGLIISERGASGGYRLGKDAKDITALEIAEALEGEIAPVACLGGDASCARYENCPAKNLWNGLRDAMREYLASQTLDKLGKAEAEKRSGGMYYI